MVLNQTVDSARQYLRQLSPHLKERQAAKIIADLISELDRRSSLDTLPCDIRVGAGTFMRGVKVSTAQGAIDRLYARMRELEQKYEPLTDDQQRLARELFGAGPHG